MRFVRNVVALVALAIGCAGTQQSAPPPVPPTPTTPEAYACPPPLPQPQQLDEVTLTERSKAFFDAVDTNDVTTVLEMVGPSFVLFDQARSYTASMLVSQMSGRTERNVKRQREWKESRVQIGPNVAIFIGDALESVPGEGGKQTEWEGWNTLVWVHDGQAWKATHAQWQPGGLEAERSMWNEAYRKSGSFKTTPNQLLVDTVKSIKRPGTALDVAMGQGRNAVFLATKGWKTTGIDISDEGIRQAKEAAQKARVRLEAIQADNDKYEYGTAKWDLVTMLYAGSDAALLDKLKASVKKGGYIVVEYFHSEATSGVGIGGFATGELAAKFDGWKVIKDEVVEDIADWSMRKMKLVRFVAQKP